MVWRGAARPEGGRAAGRDQGEVEGPLTAAVPAQLPRPDRQVPRRGGVDQVLCSRLLLHEPGIRPVLVLGG